MKTEFFAGWRAYRAGQPLDLNQSYDWKGGWRAAEVRYRGTPEASAPVEPIPYDPFTRGGLS